MQLSKIFKEDWEVNSRLVEFGVSKEELMAVVSAAVGARNDAVENDPITAAGLLSYIYGTRALRDLFRSKGWLVNRTDNIESVYNSETGIKIIFQNADHAADVLRAPRAISEKGPAAARAIEMGQGLLFPEWEEQLQKEANAAVWYLFVSANGEDVRAELSCPKPIKENQFSEFHERIFIVQKGEWDSPNILDDFDDGPIQDIEINITRK